MLIFLPMLWATGLNAQGFTIENQKSIFSDHKARAIGDVITIHIIEFSEADNKSATSTSKSSDLSVSVPVGTGSLSFLPSLSFGSTSSNAFSGQGGTSKRGSLTGKMTATIMEISPNGYYIVKGKRIIIINQDTQEMELTGIVRPRDIRADNTVFSYNIAEARITYTGKGPIHTGQRMGLIRRVAGWFF
ncbi:MAG: flagellar basal body L-ring protein FlgH [Candidatus Marinimicrobia bacterium]|nr:flagellar basal body L-ring protein FlgH [Candidatus Neomarinimicrobiota bacterium]